MVGQLVDPEFAPVSRAVSIQNASVFSDDETIAGPGRSAARAIMVAILIASPFWVLVAFTLYLLL